MFLFPKNLRLGWLYRRHVGTTDHRPSVVPAQGRYTDKGSLSSFSQGVGTTDPVSVLPVSVLFLFRKSPLGSTDPVSVVPGLHDFAQ
jgi:hypothetical protein